jgi:hypothetical protein
VRKCAARTDARAVFVEQERGRREEEADAAKEGRGPVDAELRKRK